MKAVKARCNLTLSWLSIHIIFHFPRKLCVSLGCAGSLPVPVDLPILFSPLGILFSSSVSGKLLFILQDPAQMCPSLQRSLQFKGTISHPLHSTLLWLDLKSSHGRLTPRFAICRFLLSPQTCRSLRAGAGIYLSL